MRENPIERDVNAAEGILRSQLEIIDKAAGEVAPVGKRLLTRKERLMRSLATPARTWTPKQQVWVMQQLMRERNGRS